MTHRMFAGLVGNGIPLQRFASSTARLPRTRHAQDGREGSETPIQNPADILRRNPVRLRNRPPLPLDYVEGFNAGDYHVRLLVGSAFPRRTLVV